MTRGTGRPSRERALRRAAAVLVAAGLLVIGGRGAAAARIDDDGEKVVSDGAKSSKPPDGQGRDREGPDPAGGPNGKNAPGKNPTTDRSRERATGKDGKEGPAKEPATVALPSQGVYKASELARLAGEITGLPVRIGDAGVERREIKVVPLLAGQAVSLEELKLLLAFHGVYLFDAADPEGGEVLVATTDPRWHPEQARYTQVVEVSALGFKRVWAQLKAAIDKHNAANASRPRELREADVVGLPVESVGKILLRAPNKKTLAKLVQLADHAGAQKPPADRVKLFAYVGKFRHVRDLREDVVEQLSDGERVKAKFVVMRSGNRLLYRAPGRLGERIMDLLEKLDRRRPR